MATLKNWELEFDQAMDRWDFRPPRVIYTITASYIGALRQSNQSPSSKRNQGLILRRPARWILHTFSRRSSHVFYVFMQFLLDIAASADDIRTYLWMRMYAYMRIYIHISGSLMQKGVIWPSVAAPATPATTRPFGFGVYYLHYIVKRLETKRCNIIRAQ